MKYLMPWLCLDSGTIILTTMGEVSDTMAMFGLWDHNLDNYA